MFWCHMLAAVFLVALAGCATSPRGGHRADSGTTLEDLCGKYAMDCVWDGVVQTVTMRYHGQKVQALVGSNIVMIGETRLALSAPIERRRGAVVVPADFETLVFMTERVPASEKPAVGRTLTRVIIDAGHGGKDAGATGFYGIREKDIDLDLARRVAANFREAGVEAVLTRDKDEFISLDRRSELATRPDADFYLSIHANANRNHRARGLEVYYSGILNKEDRVDLRRCDNEKKICLLFNMRRDSEALNRMVLGMLYTNKMKMSPVMADAVSRGMALDLGQPSRGSKTARYFVLRNTLIPAILVEVGFISNPREAKLLKDAAYRQKIADAITRSLMRYAYAAGI